MIRDIAQLRATGQVSRRVDELVIPVTQWRAGIRKAARREKFPVRTFVVDATNPATGHPTGQLVWAVRSDQVSEIADHRARRSGHPCTGGRAE